MGSQRDDHFVNLERRRDRDHNPTPLRMETQYPKHTKRSHSRTGSHVLHEQEARNLKLEIYHLRKKLRRKECNKRDSTSLSSEGSNGGKYQNYRQRSTTPPSESYSVSSRVDKLEKQRRRRGEISSPMSMGNDEMSKALRQISKSTFTRRIDKVNLPHRFMQPTFTIYNGRTNPVEHVSHFNQRMAT